MRSKLLGNGHSDVVNTLNNLGDVLTKQRKIAEAESVYRRAAESGDNQATCKLAWLLATSENSELRDGRDAVNFAEKSVATTNRKDAVMLSTLAAAYAETGQYEKAINCQKEAMTLTHDESSKKDYANRLKLYESNLPCRESNYENIGDGLR